CGTPRVELDLAEGAELPFTGDEAVDEGALRGGAGLEVEDGLGGEGAGGGGVFAANDLGFGIDAGLERVQARDGLALDGAAVDFLALRRLASIWACEGTKKREA